jgi:hypothetical protein
VPHARDTFQSINLVSAVKELDSRNVSDSPGIFELFGLEFVMILAFL